MLSQVQEGEMKVLRRTHCKGRCNVTRQNV